MYVSQRTSAFPAIMDAALAATVFLGAVSTAYAQPESELQSMHIPPAERFVLRMGYTLVKLNDKAGPIRELNGPVVPYGTTVAGSPNFLNWSAVGGAPLALQVLDGFGTPLSNLGIPADHPSNPGDYALGSPAGVSMDAKSARTVTISMLKYLDEEKTWALEGFVLGVPPTTDIYGAGRIGGDTATYPGVTINAGGTTVENAGGAVNLGRIASAKAMPITAMVHRFFGHKSQKLRFSLGAAATYSIFYNAKATRALELYAGGKTHTSIKNAFGVGPVAGFTYAIDEKWSLNGTLAYVKLKTTAEMTTKVDPDVLGVSPGQAQAALDIGRNTLEAIIIGQAGTVNGVSGTVDALRKLATVRTGDPHNLGTYTRKVETRLDPIIFTMSIGYSF